MVDWLAGHSSRSGGSSGPIKAIKPIGLDGLRMIGGLVGTIRPIRSDMLSKSVKTITTSTQLGLLRRSNCLR